MPTPTKHAVCSASSSSRWINCTAAPRYEEQFKEKSTSYAEEGSLAHSFCELFGRKKFTVMQPSVFESELAKLKQNKLYDDEMIQTAEFYVQFLTEASMRFNTKPHVAFEVMVDYADYAPEGFGTCDCIMLDGSTLRITDYKHGKGVAVSAINSSQMRLYALGALKLYTAIYGNTINEVYMGIVQPRITEDVTEERLTVEELRAWGETIKPKAQAAFTGIGAKFESGPWCQFCKGKAVCKARADKNTAFEEFKNCVPAGILTPESPTPEYGVLNDDEVADLLTRAADLVTWYNDLCEYAQQAILEGKTITGWKVVAGRSSRVFTDADDAIKVLTKGVKEYGIKAADLYKPKEYKTLAVLEKLIGKQHFADMVGHLITKPMGKPTLVPASDKREPYSPAVADFAGVQANG